MKISEDNEINMKIKKPIGYKNDNDKNLILLKNMI